MLTNSIGHFLWEEFRESRRCSGDTYPESYITEYIQKIMLQVGDPSGGGGGARDLRNLLTSSLILLTNRIIVLTNSILLPTNNITLLTSSVKVLINIFKVQNNNILVLTDSIILLTNIIIVLNKSITVLTNLILQVGDPGGGSGGARDLRNLHARDRPRQPGTASERRGNHPHTHTHTHTNVWRTFSSKRERVFVRLCVRMRERVQGSVHVCVREICMREIARASQALPH